MSREVVSPEQYRKGSLAAKFVEEVLGAGFEPFHYHGKFFFEGPAVITDNIQSVIRATTQEVQWDSMGLEYVVYPRSSGKLLETVNENCK